MKLERTQKVQVRPSAGLLCLHAFYSNHCPPELWSVTMVFVSCLSNAIITLNSYSVKRTSLWAAPSLPGFESQLFEIFSSLAPRRANTWRRVSRAGRRPRDTLHRRARGRGWK